MSRSTFAVLKSLQRGFLKKMSFSICHTQSWPELNSWSPSTSLLSMHLRTKKMKQLWRLLLTDNTSAVTRSMTINTPSSEGKICRKTRKATLSPLRLANFGVSLLRPCWWGMQHKSSQILPNQSSSPRPNLSSCSKHTLLYLHYLLTTWSCIAILKKPFCRNRLLNERVLQRIDEGCHRANLVSNVCLTTQTTPNNTINSPQT